MSAILKFDCQTRKQLRFSEVQYLNYTKKDPILHVIATFFLKQGQTRTSSGHIPHSLRVVPTPFGRQGLKYLLETHHFSISLYMHEEKNRFES